MIRSAALLLTVSLLASGCGSPDEVEVQPLPSLERSSPEARAGLPEIVGAWRFAGWELAPTDSLGLRRDDLPRFGTITLDAQRRDSVGGQYVVQAGSAPLYGEVRRDGVISLIGVFGPGDLRFLTGRVASDTVWMELTSLTEPGGWPTGARAAFVRATAVTPFVRLRGALPPVVARADTAPPLPPGGAAAPPGTAVVTPGAPPATTPSPGARVPTPGATPAPPAVTRPAPAPVTPAPRPTPPPRQEEEEEEPQPQEEPPVPLLGEPTVEDPGPQD